MNDKRRTRFLGGDWEDFELDFIDKHFPLWKQNIIEVVSELFKHRIKMRMSQAELAERIGTTQSAIARFEHLKKMPSLEYIYRVAAGLGAEIKPLKLIDKSVKLPKAYFRSVQGKAQWEKDLYQIVYSLKEYRILHNISQAELAQKIGTGQSVIARFEALGRKPTLEFIYRVAEGLGLELQLLSAEKEVAERADIKSVERSSSIFANLEMPLLNSQSPAQIPDIINATYRYRISKCHIL